MAKLFERRHEDFTCEHCRKAVSGGGYTNHCPRCLWSKHVDVNPGDRAEKCRGMMKPAGLDKEGEVFFIRHKCERCGFERRNKAVKGDNFEELVKLSIGAL